MELEVQRAKELIEQKLAEEEEEEPAVQGKMPVIEKFLADGGPPDTCDEFHRTALHRSSLEGHTDILQKLLDSGATVDFRDRAGKTPTDLVQQWQVDTRQALETKEQPTQGDVEVPA
nr:PREDICTED: ankyrin repeat domain-containing protein 2 [Opisthocomus hoazin]